MVKKEKTRIMIDLARYDRDDGKKNYIINSYFMSDYVGRYMIGGFISFTLCYVLVTAISIICRFEEIMAEPDITQIVKMVKPYGVYYLAGLVIYEVIIILVYALRYSKGKRQIRVNTAKLKRLKKVQ